MGRYTGTAAADPNQKQPTQVPTTTSGSTATPKNSTGIRHIRQEALNLIQDPQARLLINKLANAALGGLVEGFLGQSRAAQLEAAMAEQVEDAKEARRRKKLTTDRAITGEELMRLRLAQLSLEANPSTPRRRRTGPRKRVTFSNKPQRKQSSTPISISSTSSSDSYVSLDDLSALSADENSDDDSSSIASTIYVATPARPPPARPREPSASPTPGPSQSTGPTDNEGGSRRSLRLKRS